MIKKVVRAIAFTILLAVILLWISDIGTYVASGVGSYRWRRGFYQEPEGALDAVYIGASAAHMDWMTPLAWERYGIAAALFTNNSQPLDAVEYLIREARKTQPDAVYIISINEIPLATLRGFRTPYEESTIHWTTDYMPFSSDKVELIERLCDLGGYSRADRAEYYFPLLRYHSSWESITKDCFVHPEEGIKGAPSTGKFFSGASDVSGSYRNTTRRMELPDTLQESVESLLDYCDREGVKAMFVTSPQARVDEDIIAQWNTINDMIRSRGYPTLNMMECLKEVGIDYSRDFCDFYHLNIHGTIKFTDFLASHLQETFGFTGEHDEEVCRSWDEAAAKYREMAAPYVLDFEWEGEPRDESLAAPALTGLGVNGTALTLSWGASEGAEGYRVYRKTADAGWTPIAETDAGTLYYTDTDCEINGQYTYTVAPYREAEGERRWGYYNTAGLTATAVMAAPQNLTGAGEEDDYTLTWEAVDGADGYQVARRVFARSWLSIADTWEGTSYTDREMLEQMPYQYRVRAYWYNEAGVPMYGTWSVNTLYLPELAGPDVTVEVIDGKPELNWTPVEGISGYTVSRRSEEGTWEAISEGMPAGITGYRDETAEAGETYAYQVTAYLAYGKQMYQYPTETELVEVP